MDDVRAVLVEQQPLGPAARAQPQNNTPVSAAFYYKHVAPDEVGIVSPMSWSDGARNARASARVVRFCEGAD